METQDVWTNEERLWLEGGRAFAQLMHAGAIMAFAAPVGIMQGSTIVESLKAAPRWQSVAMRDRATCAVGRDTVVIAYAAEGQRDGAPPYRAYCTSTHIREGGSWRIIQHQQTPVD